MRIDICNEEGVSKVRIISPGTDGADDTVVSETNVESGQLLPLTLPTVDGADGIELGELTDAPQPA